MKAEPLVMLFLVLQTIPIRLFCIIFLYPCKTKGQIKEKTSQLCFPVTVSLLTPISFAAECWNSLQLHPQVQYTQLIVSILYFYQEPKKKKQITCPWNWKAPDGVADALRLMKPSIHRSFHMTETDREETWLTSVSSTECKARIPTVLKVCYRLSFEHKTFTQIPPTPTLFSGYKCVPVAPWEIFKGSNQNWHFHLPCRGNLLYSLKEIMVFFFSEYKRALV